MLESSSAALVKDMNRAGLTSFGIPGCDSDVLEIFQRWKAQDRLNVRVFCIGGTAAGTPEQVERSIQQIAGMKLFQGDNFVDNIAFGESVYSPLHDPMFALKSDPQPDQLEQWRRIALEIAKAGLPLHVHAELHNTIDAFLDQIEAVNKEHPVKNLRWVFAHVNQIDASQIGAHEEAGNVCGRESMGRHQWRDHARRVRRRRLRHATAEHDTEQRHRMGTGNRWNRGQSIPALHDAVFCRDRQDGGWSQSHAPNHQPRRRPDCVYAQERELRF